MTTIMKMLFSLMKVVLLICWKILKIIWLFCKIGHEYSGVRHGVAA